MSDTTRDINRVTTAIIKVSLRLIIYALSVLVLYEGMTAGFRFGHEIFGAKAVSEPPGIVKTVVVEEGQTGSQVGDMLEKEGLIRNRHAFAVQAMFYDYEIYPGAYVLNSSMTPKEILEELSVKPEDGEGVPGT
ncbi:MAG: endolytic transglycosylase MltG [Lachnospiraceae bacterium]|nr:endolytic transglycosylase MltG [Lachnospiraceae bacterium]